MDFTIRSSDMRRAIYDNDVLGVIRMLETTDISQAAQTCPPLYLACCLNRVEIVRAMLGVETTDAFVVSRSGSSPLQVSCALGLVEVTKLLLRAVDVWLISAVRRGDHAAMASAMRSGADKEAKVPRNS